MPRADGEPAPEPPEYRGRKLLVHRQRYVLPDGRRVELDAVRVPAVAYIVPLLDDGRVVLIRQYRPIVDAEIWELPAGTIEPGESPEVCARRELVEEAGLAPETLEHLVTFHNSPGFSDEAVVVYAATGLTEVPDDRQGAEEQHMVVQRVPLDEALAMVDDGRITDAKSVIALLALDRRRRTGG